MSKKLEEISRSLMLSDFFQPKSSTCQLHLDGNSSVSRKKKLKDISRILMLSGLSQLKSFVNCILRRTYGSVSKKMKEI